MIQIKEKLRRKKLKNLVNKEEVVKKLLGLIKIRFDYLVPENEYVKLKKLQKV